ncbi:MAG: hypothetical protein Kow0073_18280 [Immundisolibacter sp.]
MTEPLAPPPWYRQRWFWLVAAPPLAAVVGGLMTVWIAMHHADALVVDDYARIGRAFELDQSRDRRARSLGVSAALQLDRASGAFTLSVRGVPAQALELKLLHPTDPAGDRRLTVSPDPDGRYSGHLEPLDATRRELEIASLQQGWRLRGVLPAGAGELQLGPP